MAIRWTKITLILPLMAAALSATAQEDQQEPLILDEKPQIKATVRDRGEAKQAKESTSKADPTPSPDETLVAIVNSRVLTKAEIDERVSQRFEELKKKVQSETGGIVTVLGDAEVALPELSWREQMKGMEEGEKEVFFNSENREDELLEAQKYVLEAEMRRAEEEVLNDWVSYRMLADEARRQGIVVMESEFQQRLAEAEREAMLSAEDVETALEELRMSRADYEKSIYDALLIEKLLDRFIDLNYSQSFLRERYEKAPHLYREPEKFLMAHFVVNVDNVSGRDALKARRDLAQEVRKLLRDGQDPEQIFQKSKYSDFESGVFGSVPGWYTLQEGQLPPQVSADASKLDVGETSKVIVQHTRTNSGEVVPKTLHVVKILDRKPPTGDTFESAMPTIRRAMLEIARVRLLERLHAAGTHRVITNLGGIPPRLIPSPDELMKHEAQAEPISLKIPRS